MVMHFFHKISYFSAMLFFHTMAVTLTCFPSSISTIAFFSIAREESSPAEMPAILIAAIVGGVTGTIFSIHIALAVSIITFPIWFFMRRSLNRETWWLSLAIWCVLGMGLCWVIGSWWAQLPGTVETLASGLVGSIVSWPVMFCLWRFGIRLDSSLEADIVLKKSAGLKSQQ